MVKIGKAVEKYTLSIEKRDLTYTLSLVEEKKALF